MPTGADYCVCQQVDGCWQTRKLVSQDGMEMLSTEFMYNDKLINSILSQIRLCIGCLLAASGDVLFTSGHWYFTLYTISK